MLNQKKIIAIMPIKLNNERLQGKNTKPLNGKPLLVHQLEMLSSLDMIDEIFVYCSNPEIKQYLPEKVQYLQRHQELDLPTANFSEIFQSFIQQKDADIYVYTHATAPFVTRETAMDCICAVAKKEYDSAFCAVKIQDFLWKDNRPLNFCADKLPRSQDLEPVWRETSGVYVFTKKVFTDTHRRIGVHPYIKQVTFKESIDINTHEDFTLAQILAKENI